MTAPTTNGTGSSGIWQLFKERRSRDALYGESTYWDARTSARRGMARSLWPSNAYNQLWDERQRTLITRALGEFTGRRVVDVGCGTGRMVRWLAEQRGASHVVGIDFSPVAIEAARRESTALLSSGLVRFEVGNVIAGLERIDAGAFDDALVLGCLAVACPDKGSLERALASVTKLVRKGGRVVLLEPIHRSPLLRRVLALGIEDWIGAANRAGLSLVYWDRMGFVPLRLVLSVRDLPRSIVAPLFRAGERLLDSSPWLSPLSDYKLLSFLRA